MLSWIAKELAYKDKTMTGFWPLQDDGADYSGFSTYLTNSSNIIASTWLQWLTAWNAINSSWSSLSTLPEIKIVKSGGRMGFSTANSTEFATLETHNDIDGNLRLQNSQPFCVSAWFRPDSIISSGGLLSQATIVSGDPFSFRGWEVVFDTGFLIARFSGIGSGDETSIQCYPSELSQTSWLHIFVVFIPARFDGIYYTPVTIKLYINGRRVQTVDNNAAIYSAPTGAPFLIGATPRTTFGGGDSFVSPDGVISLVRFYSRELFEREIRDLYLRELRLNREDTFVIGTAIPASDIPLTTYGHDSISSTIYIHTIGGWPNDFISFYLEGANRTLSSNLDLYVSANPQESLTLYVEGGSFTSVTPESIPLYLWSTTNSGLYDLLPLYLSGVFSYESIDLFVQGPSTDALSAYMPLYLSGEYPYVIDSIPLYLSGSTDVYCPTVWENWGSDWEDIDALWDCQNYVSTATGSVYFLVYGPITGLEEAHIPLHIRAGVTEELPLYVCGPPIPVNPENIPIFLKGGYLISEQLPFFTIGSNQINSSQLPLYTHGF